MKYVNQPIFRWDTEPWFGFHAPKFEPSLIEMLKSVPIRAWDSEQKTWWYPKKYWPVVEASVAGYFPEESRAVKAFIDQGSASAVKTLAKVKKLIDDPDLHEVALVIRLKELMGSEL